MIEKDFVPHQPSLDMKELGFDELGFGYYDEDAYLFTVREQDDIDENWLPAPTWSQAFRWFREKYKLFVQPNRTIDSPGIWYYFSIETRRGDICEGSFIYEEAELACLKKLIEIVKNK